ncbi:MAG TPA: redoxin family protein [Blastocatellia bacterium]|nr:redoxin family protein [Blastocatellia bacterium]
MFQEMGSNLASKSGVFLTAALVICMGLSLSVAQAQSPTLKPGDVAPEIKLAKLLQAATGQATDWKSLKGTIVVLEFWATWCSPCMPAITHLNELADKFKDQPIQFIAITDEDDGAMLTQFLKQKPIHGWVGIDPGAVVFKAYGVGGRPHTVLVDQNGKVAAITEARNITAATLNDLLAGKQIALPLKIDVLEDMAWDKKEATDKNEPLFQVIIKTSNATFSRIEPQPGRVTADGAQLMVLICWAYETPIYRVFSHLPASTQQYKMSVVAPPGRQDLLHPLTQQALETTFGIKTRRETRDLEMLVLSVPEGAATTLPFTSRKGGGVFCARSDKGTETAAPEAGPVPRTNNESAGCG